MSVLSPLRHLPDQARRALRGALGWMLLAAMLDGLAGLALVPLLLATGPGSEIQKPLAIVVIGGLITSTFLSLLVIPAVFTYVDDLAQWFGRRLHRHAATPGATPLPRAPEQTAP